MTLTGQTEAEIHKLFSDNGFIQERQTLQLAENVNKHVRPVERLSKKKDVQLRASLYHWNG